MSAQVTPAPPANGKDSSCATSANASTSCATPDSVSQRYERMCARLGWDFTIKELRHYSATELISAGVDLRAVAGQLGHSGGGLTTLRLYSAWRPEADSRAATTLGARLPLPPGLTEAPGGALAPSPELAEHFGPYQRIAADLRGAIDCGALGEGDPIPTLRPSPASMASP